MYRFLKFLDGSNINCNNSNVVISLCDDGVHIENEFSLDIVRVVRERASERCLGESFIFNKVTWQKTLFCKGVT